MITRGSNPQTVPVAEEPLPGKVNYLIGNDSQRWVRNIPTYAKVRYPQVYKGIDLVYYATEAHLEFDFIVQPGAHPETIRLGFEGATNVQISSDGALTLVTDVGELKLQKPTVYQERAGQRQTLDARFVSNHRGEVSFEVGHYDAGRPLVIDPVVVFSTYLGGSQYDEVNGVAVDTSGNTYVTGRTFSSDFPTASPFQTDPGADSAFVVKLNANGSGFVHATYLGGSRGDRGMAIAVDNAGSAYVAGGTTSQNFPTMNPVQESLAPGNCATPPFTFPCEDWFVAKLNPTGSGLVYSTYLGGTLEDLAQGIALDSSRNVYVSGYARSTNFPTLNAFQATSGGQFEAAVAKLGPTGSLVFATYLGGSGDDYGTRIAVTPASEVVVVGTTRSGNFPVASAIQSNKGSTANFDAFVTKLTSTGTALIFSTYLGGSLDDGGNGVALDASGNAYITGLVRSSDFPLLNPLRSTNVGGDAFLTKLSPGGTLLYSTFLGGSGFDIGSSVQVSVGGDIYVVGATQSTDFPLVKPLQTGKSSTDLDIFVLGLKADGQSLGFSTYYGGASDDGASFMALDSSGHIYVVGSSSSANFPTVNALRPSFAGVQDGVVLKLEDVLTVTIDIKPGSYPNTLNLGSNGVVPVAIFSSPTFDARTVDPATLTLASAPVRVRGQGAPAISFADANHDGLVDIVAQFETEALQLTSSDTIAVLEGQTSNGRRIRGSDTIRVVP